MTHTETDTDADTETYRDIIESTTAAEDVTVTVPDDVVVAVAARLEALDDPDEDAARDIALDHVDLEHHLVTEDGRDVTTAALERLEPPTKEHIDLRFDEDTLEDVDALAEAAGVSRSEWIRRAADERLDTTTASDEADDVTLEYDDVETETETDAEPIAVDAIAELDYTENPDRPMSIELEVPPGVIDEDDLDDALAAVSIDARIADE